MTTGRINQVSIKDSSHLRELLTESSRREKVRHGTQDLRDNLHAQHFLQSTFADSKAPSSLQQHFPATPRSGTSKPGDSL